jgi:hypothetical protein
MIALFGGLISSKLVILNLYFLLPLIFIAQSMPFHAIKKEKIQYIRNNKKYLSNKLLKLPRDEVVELSREAKKLNMATNELIEIISYSENYDDKCIIPYYLNIMKRKFYSSWRNPFSPQGIIIFCFILNLLCLKYKYKFTINKII